MSAAEANRPQCRAAPWPSADCAHPGCGGRADGRDPEGYCFHHSEAPAVVLERSIWRERAGRKR